MILLKDRSFLESAQEDFRKKVLAVNLISRFYPLEKKQVIRYKDVLNMSRDHLMNNPHINWSCDLLAICEGALDWTAIWKLQKVELNRNFFEQYSDQIDFESIILSKKIDWSNELLDNFSERWDWKGNLNLLSIVGKERNLRRYKDRLNWEKASKNIYIHLHPHLIKEFEASWHWKTLSSNPNLPLSVSFLREYGHLLDFDALSSNPAAIPLIQKYPNSKKWNWLKVAQNRALVYTDYNINFCVNFYLTQVNPYSNFSLEQQRNFARRQILLSASKGLYQDKEFLFKPDNLQVIGINNFLMNLGHTGITEQEAEMIITSENIKEMAPILGKIASIIPKKVVEENEEWLKKFPRLFYRYMKIPPIKELNNLSEDDWFNLSFNENYEWSKEFLTQNIDKLNIDPLGLATNKEVYEKLIADESQEKIDSFLSNY